MRDTKLTLSQGLLLAALLTITFFSACARRLPPGGGPYDDRPPRLVRSTPEPQALNVSGKKIVLHFDEYVKVEDIQKKVIISPPQLQQPSIMAVGKRVIVDLEDDLRPNTTYTLDFTDAIVDNNEGNPLENFSFAFSTGAEIDTMEISGVVLDARNHEPVQGVVVGIHPDSAGHSAFRDTTFLRMSRTSDRAKFILRNMKHGTYSVYALQESDGNYRHDMATEGIAFLDSLITTSSMAATRMDTTWVDSLTIDTVQLVHYTRFMPDDLVLRFFQPEVSQRHISKRERPDLMRLKLTFNQLPKKAPLIQPVDSLFTPLPDSLLPKYYALDSQETGEVDVFFMDSTWSAYSRFEVSYFSVDSLDLPVMVRDTLQLRYRPVQETKEKERKEEKEKVEEEEGETPTEKSKSPFSVRVEHKGEGGIADSILFITSLPIDTTALKGIELYNANDSILQPVPLESVALLPGRTTVGMIKARLRYNTAYEIYFDSLAFRDVYGHTLDNTVVDAFRTKTQDEFSHLEVILQGITDTPYIVELLNMSDQPIRVGYAEAGKSVKFRDLKPDKYAFRVIIDRNGNGKWDTGDYASLTQPEEVYYSPKILELMKNWEVKENFNPFLTKLELQKPRELIKNKPAEKKRRDLNKEREEELRRQREGGGLGGGGFGGGGFGGLGGGGGLF